MRAIYKRELLAQLRGAIGWTVIAVLLFFVGIYFTAYNLQGQIPYFGVVLSAISFILIFLCPALSMRTFSEEKRQKTEILLLTSPVSLTAVVLGKYLSLLTVFAIPTVISGLYPLILTAFGTVPLLETYATLLAFFLLGAACLAIGVFFSSITENQIVAFISTVAVLLVSCLMDGIKGFATSGSQAGAILFSAVALAVGGLAWYLSKSFVLGAGVFTVLEITLAGASLFRSSALASAFDSALNSLALFNRFDGFLSGTLDLTGYFYLITVSVLFLFFTVQVLEKRRWS